MTGSAGDSTVSVVIEEATTASAEVVDALAVLVPQLSSSATAPGAEEVGEITTSPATVLLTARLEEGGPVIGSLTLVVFRIPTGLRAWIEDVVVDGSARGRGVGAALTRAALARARDMGCRNVDLTSRPSREDANRLYRRLGFVARETNVYRMDLGGPEPGA